MADRKLAIVFTADPSNAKRGISELNAALGSTEDAGKRSVSGLKSALGGLAIGAFVVDGMRALGEIDRINKQTESAIKATGGAAKVTAGQVEELAGALERKTGIEAESIQSGENLILTFKGIKNEAGAGRDIFDRSTKAALDLSVALGTDMTSASMMLGKALNEPVSGMSKLRKAGVDLTADQQALVRQLAETGDVAGAQAVILDELEAQVGGSAEAYGESLPGQIAKAKNALGDIQEAILSGAVPALEAGAAAVTGLAHVLTGLPQPVQTGLVVIGGAAAVWAKWGDTLTSTATKAVEAGRTISTALDGIAATRGISKTQAGLEALKASLSTSVSEFGTFKSAAVAAAAGLAAFGATTSILEGMAEFHGDLSGLAKDLDQYGRGVADTGVITDRFGGSIESLAGKFKIAYDNSSLAERGARALTSAFKGDSEGFTAVRQAQSDIEALDTALAQNVESGNVDAAKAAYADLASALMDQGVAASDIAAYMPKYWDAIERAGRESSAAGDKTEEATEKVKQGSRTWGEMAGKVSSVGEKFADLKEKADAARQAISDFYDATTARVEAAMDAEAALDSLSTSLADNGANLDINTEAGRNNMGALIGVKDAAVDAGLAALEQGASSEEAAGLMQGYVDRLVDTARQAGLSEDQIAVMIRTMGLTPEQIMTTISNNAPQTRADVDAYGRALDRQDGRVVNTTLAIHTAIESIGSSATLAIQQAIAGRRGMAKGGLVTGGTPGRDSVPMMLMPGEYVVTKEAAKRVGLRALEALNGKGTEAAGSVHKLDLAAGKGQEGAGLSKPAASAVATLDAAAPVSVAMLEGLSFDRRPDPYGQIVHQTVVHVAGSVITERELQRTVKAQQDRRYRSDGPSAIMPAFGRRL